MASPHVAGVAALYLAANPNAEASDVKAAIVNGATSNIITMACGTTACTRSPNKFLNLKC